MKKLLLLFGLLFLTGCSQNQLLGGPTVIHPYQGGTGTSTAAVGDIGKALIISSVSPLVYAFGATSGGGSAFSSCINSTNGSTTSSLCASTFNVATSSAALSGKFSVDASGNTSASGTLSVFGLSLFSGGLISSASSSFAANLQVLGALNASSTLTVATTSTLATTTIGSGPYIAGSALTIYGGDLNWKAKSGAYLNCFNTTSQPGAATGQCFLVSPAGKSTVFFGNDTNAGFGSVSTNMGLQLFASNIGVMYFDSTGQVTPGGGPGLTRDNLEDFGSSSTRWRYGNFFGGVIVGNSTVTSTYDLTQIKFAQQTGFNSGKFNVDSSGNVSASGTLGVAATSTFADGIVSTKTTNIGWSVQSAANQACDTTCISACVEGEDSGTVGVLNSSKVNCNDATADKCTCAGPN